MDGRFQFFPSDWQAEFYQAGRIGFDSIEWLVDWPDWETNPVVLSSLHGDIQKETQESGVGINSICADYFMKFKLTGPDGKKSSEMAVTLVHRAAQLTRNKLVLIPFLEENAYGTEAERIEVLENLLPAVRAAEKLGAYIGLETEMTANELVEFLGRFQSDAIGVYYDIGNCTSYGFNCPSDIRKLGRRVFGVHIKDRKKGSPQSLMLGEGDADIEGCLSALQAIGYRGVPVMQAWRGTNYLEDAQMQLKVLQGIKK